MMSFQISTVDDEMQKLKLVNVEYRMCRSHCNSASHYTRRVTRFVTEYKANTKKYFFPWSMMGDESTFDEHKRAL